MPEPLKSSGELPDFNTICAHWGEDRTEYHGAVIPPIYQNSLFTYPDCETRTKAWSHPMTGGDAAGENAIGAFYDYTRVSNPTTDIAEAKIAAMEGGEKARCFGSGMGAISAAILACVKSGDHVVAPNTVYGPTRQFLTDWLPRFGVTASFIDGSDPGEWEAACRPETTLLYLESPSSVLMRQQDLAAVAEIARARGIHTICDNSWASPLFQNPLKLGIDLVVHSATKYLGGHSDIVAGVVIGDAPRMKKLTFNEGCLLGAVLDPFAAWLLLRGLRTLPVRMQRHQENARTIVTRLQAHSAVARLFYPGMEGDPQAELTRRQLRGSSGLLSLELKTQGREAAYRFVDSLHYFGIGCSWGGFESLALPASVPASVLGGDHDGAHWLVRLHIGLESVDALWDDIEAALQCV